VNSQLADSEILEVVTGAVQKPVEEYPGEPAGFWRSAVDDLRPTWSRREVAVLVVRIPARVCWTFIFMGAVFVGLSLAAVLAK
jgi:hypothetical protein